MERLTEGSMVLPFSRAATLSISNSEELVQEPMQTWSTFVPFRERDLDDIVRAVRAGNHRLQRVEGRCQ